MSSDRLRTVAIVVAGLIVIALLARACTSGSGSGADPTSYIEQTYERESNLDEDGIKAYVADGQTPQTVASDISADAEPIDRRASSENAAADGGDSVFLQYSDEIVSIFPYEGGSKVMLGDYEQAHSHYFVYLGGWWAPTPGYGGGGSGNRGGGAGTGK